MADARAADIYYRSLVVTFASVRRWNEHLPLLFVTDGETPKPYSSALRALGVETESVAFEHRPPSGFAQTHIASLYSLDALSFLSVGRYGQVSLLDPDVLCRGDLSQLLSGTKKNIGALPCGAISADAIQLHLALDETLGQAPSIFYEGVCYVVDPMHFPVLLQKADQAWRLSLANASIGLKYFTTEQDVLNFALRSVPVVSIRPYIATIWTTRTQRTVPPDVERLPLWHLPSEKDRALARLFEPATDSTSWFWAASGEEYAKMIRRVTQIPRRSAIRWACDSGARPVRRLESAIRRTEPTTVPSVSASCEIGPIAGPSS